MNMLQRRHEVPPRGLKSFVQPRLGCARADFVWLSPRSQRPGAIAAHPALLGIGSWATAPATPAAMRSSGRMDAAHSAAACGIP